MPRRQQTEAANSLAHGPVIEGLRVKGRLWVEKDGQTYLSWGRVVLLERIGQLGSLAAAARSMGMAYRHAWGLLRDMERAAGQPLLQRRAGGSGGGGAQLTPAGQEAVRQFWALVVEFQAWLEARQVKLG